MNVEYINPFIEASKSVLKSIANIEISTGKPYLKSMPHKSDAIIIIVGLTGKLRGQVIFNMPTTTCMLIASRMMGGLEVIALDEMTKSAVTELTNIILGNTATILSNRGILIDITPPSFLIGENIVISSMKSQTISIPMILNDEHQFEIDISIAE